MNRVDDFFNESQIVTKKTPELTDFTDSIKNAILNSDDIKNKKIHALMLFDTEFNLGRSNKPNKWVNYRNIYTTDGEQALYLYCNIPVPASQLVSGESIEELNLEMQKMVNNFNNQEFLNELYDYL